MLDTGPARPARQAGAIPVLLGPYPPGLGPLHRLLPALPADGPADLGPERLAARYPELAGRLDRARAAGDPAAANPVAAAYWERRVRDRLARALGDSESGWARRRRGPAAGGGGPGGVASY